MSTLSPALAEAFDLLHSSLYLPLDEAEFLALKGPEWTEEDGDAAYQLILDLVLVIRGLVYEHRVQPDGDCRICTSAWPCPVITLIYGLLKDPQGHFADLVGRAPDGA